MKLVFLGSPGVGKGTYAVRIKNKLGILHISTGDLLRDEIKAGTEIGIEAASYMDKGHFAPDEIVIRVLKKRIGKKDCINGFILDGFPRTIAQAEMLEDITDIDRVVYFYASKETIIERLSGRRTCSQCGRIFHLTNIPPKVDGVCDYCSGDLVQRSDETPEIIEERLKVYDEKTAPLIKYYKEKGKLLEVEGEGPADEIVEETIKKLKSEKALSEEPMP